MKLSIVRGAEASPFELQNYASLRSDYDIQIITSKKYIPNNINLVQKRLFSPANLSKIPFIRYLLNRIYSEAHSLFGLSRVISNSDIVHVEETYFGFSHQSILAKRRGVVKKIVCSVWDVLPSNIHETNKLRYLNRHSFENIDMFIVPTQKIKEYLLNAGVGDKRVHIIRLGTDLSKFKPVQKKRQKRHIRILCVASLTQDSGVLNLLEVFQQIYQKNKKIWLTFVGDGPLKNDLKGYKNVSVKNIPYWKIHHEYQASDIYCMPFLSPSIELFGGAITNALASGLPVVTSDTENAHDLYGDTVLYSKQKNKAMLKANIERLIYDQDLRQHVGKISRAYAIKEFDSRNTAKQILDVYASLFGK